MADIGRVITFEPAEKKRTYWFMYDQDYSVAVELENVVELTVRESGTHRLKTADGKFHIIPPGWIHIELEMDDWTV